MLEEDLRTMFDKQATASQPPTRFSVASITRRARTARRRQIAAGVASPVVAVGAVAAIALAGVLPGGAGGHPTRRGVSVPVTSVPATAPRQFNPFQAYAALGWMPGHDPLHVRDFLFMYEQDLYYLGISVDIQAAGQCGVRHKVLVCKHGQYAITDNRIGRPVGIVDGHQAYWTAPSGGPLGSRPVLNWQYARDAWATLEGQGLTNALRIARHVRFGPAVAKPVRFTVQFEHVPASWHVSCVIADWDHSVEFASSYNILGSHPAADQGCSPPNVANLDEGVGYKGACVPLVPHGVRGVINGFQVLTENSQGSTMLCANDADGIFVWIERGGHPKLSVVSLFAHHLRLFGPDPRRWAIKPIG